MQAKVSRVLSPALQARLLRWLDAAIAMKALPLCDPEVRLCRRLLAGDQYRVLLLGRYNAGKTTLINALLGLELPTGPNPTTQGFDEAPWGEAGAVLVDSEGSDAATQPERSVALRGSALDEQIGRADLVILVVPLDGLEAEASYAELDRVNAAGKPKLLVVRWECKPDSRSERADRGAIAAKFRCRFAGIAPGDVFFVNSLDAIKARRGGKRRLLAYSNLPRLARALTERSAAFWRQLPALAASVLSRMVGEAAPDRQAWAVAMALEARILLGLVAGTATRSLQVPVSGAALLWAGLRAAGRPIEVVDGSGRLYCEYLDQRGQLPSPFRLPRGPVRLLFRHLVLIGLIPERLRWTRHHGRLVLVGCSLGPGCRLSLGGRAELFALACTAHPTVPELGRSGQAVIRILGFAPGLGLRAAAVRPTPGPSHRLHRAVIVCGLCCAVSCLWWAVRSLGGRTHSRPPTSLVAKDVFADEPKANVGGFGNPGLTQQEQPGRPGLADTLPVPQAEQPLDRRLDQPDLEPIALGQLPPASAGDVPQAPPPRPELSPVEAVPGPLAPGLVPLGPTLRPWRYLSARRQAPEPAAPARRKLQTVWGGIPSASTRSIDETYAERGTGRNYLALPSFRSVPTQPDDRDTRAARAIPDATMAVPALAEQWRSDRGQATPAVTRPARPKQPRAAEVLEWRNP